jgi:hypothetical protein
MKQKLLFTNVISKLLVLVCFLLCNTAFGADYYLRSGSGNWVSTTTAAAGGWFPTATGGTAYAIGSYPQAGDNVFIMAHNAVLTINTANAACNNMTFFQGLTSAATTAAQNNGLVLTGVSGICNLTVNGNFIVSTVATANTVINTRTVNVNKSDSSITSLVTIKGDIIVGASTNNYISGITGTSLIKRLNTINFGTLSGSAAQYNAPNVEVQGNVNMFSHQIPGTAGDLNGRYNLSSVRLNSGKMTLTGTVVMTSGSEETTGKGYVKSFRKGTSEGMSTDNRFFISYSEADATLELNHHTDNPFYTTGNVAISYPQIQQGIIIYKSTSGNPSVISPNVYRHLTIDNSAGSSIDVLGSGATAIGTVKVNNSLSLVSGTLNAGGESILDIGASGFILYMKGGELTTDADSNFTLSNKISIYYSDNATTPGIELAKAMGTGEGFAGNQIDMLVLNPGSAGVSFDFNTTDIEADVISFRRPLYELTSGIFHAQVKIELDGNNANYNGCVFDTPRLDIKANSILSTAQTVRTTTGSTVNSYTSSGDVKLGTPSGPITVTLGGDLTTTNVEMLGAVTLARSVGIVDPTYFNVHGFFKLGDDVTYDLTSNGILTLKSLAFETASVSKQESYSGEIIGDVNVERYLTNDGGDGGGRYWRLLTAPVIKNSGADVTSIYKHWQNNGSARDINGLGYGTDVWGSNASYTMAANGMYYLNPGTHNFRKYVSSAQTVGAWTNVSNTYTEELFNDTTNNAFLAFIIKPFGQGITVGDPNTSSTGSVSTVLSATGKLRFGSVNVSIKKNRYYLIGNPYASPILISALFSSNSNKTTNTLWVLDSKLGSFGGYVTFSNGTWSDPTAIHNGSTTIQSGEGFFVKGASSLNDANTNNFTITEGLKTTPLTTASVFGRSAETSELMRVLLKKVANNVTSHEDGSTVKFYTGGINEVDESDSEKFSNPAGTISLINGSTKLAIENRALVVAGDEVFVNVSNATANTDYKLHIYTENFTFSGVATLHDLKLGTTTVMPIDGSVFEYPFTVTSDATTQGTRFKIVFGNAVLSVDENANVNGVKVYPNPVAKSASMTLNLGTLENNIYNYRITNILGQTIQTGKLDKTELNQEFAIVLNAAFSAGLYAIEVLDQNKVINTSKIIIK